jgi:MFS family permease
MIGSRRGGASLGARTFGSFKNRVYRIYFGGMLGQMAAMNMQQVVGSLLIYRLTGSAAILGAMSFAGAVPMICFSLFGGVIADRFDKRKVMIAGQAAFAVVSLAVALAITVGYLTAQHVGSWWVLAASSVLQGSVMGLMMPSRQAILPEIVSEDQLMNAVSLNTMGMNVLQLVAPALAGFLVDASGFAMVYYVMTAMYITAVVFVCLLPTVRTAAKIRISAFDSIAKGFSYVRHNTDVLYVLLFTMAIVLLAMPYNNLMPIFVDDVLHVGATGMGVLMSVSGIGAMIGSVVLASLPTRRRGVMLGVSGVILGLALTAFAFSRSWPLSLVLIALVGLGQTGRMTLSSTLVQSHVDSEYMGRVMSVFMMQFGFTSFSTFLAGLLTQGVGVQWAIGSFAILLAVISVAVLIFVPRIRRLD